ncbi:helix-turn-helix domain-containing protein [Niallia taxi]|uniref:helix-turn-helix domain-containing protein n=1 Tax=Niallia taxi TaxID=2499688 RepID=UPI002E1F1432|nr:helix-turn-helix domain-containing protein [Niallia taxi]
MLHQFIGIPILNLLKYLTVLWDGEFAFVGNVCRSICCNLFSKYIEQTTNNYLIGYRIQKNCEMLKETKRSISEIAIACACACGFQSGSYFSYTFRRKMGYGPQY